MPHTVIQMALHLSIYPQCFLLTYITNNESNIMYRNGKTQDTKTSATHFLFCYISLSTKKKLLLFFDVIYLSSFFLAKAKAKGENK